jgi:hypothetical protein
LAETKKVRAGTLNPYLPKRTIASAHLLEWLEEPAEDDLAWTGRRTSFASFNPDRKPHHWRKRKLARDLWALLDAVPELTRSADIKLNKRVSLPL